MNIVNTTSGLRKTTIRASEVFYKVTLRIYRPDPQGFYALLYTHITFVSRPTAEKKIMIYCDIP